MVMDLLRPYDDMVSDSNNSLEIYTAKVANRMGLTEAEALFSLSKSTNILMFGFQEVLIVSARWYRPKEKIMIV